MRSWDKNFRLLSKKKRIDDLQPLLIELLLTGTVSETYFESNNFPVDQYLEYKRVSTDATSECCPDPRSMTVYLSEVANVPLLLRDPLKNPDFELPRAYSDDAHWRYIFLCICLHCIQ